jgi:GNAT superfamily N-acetyltransferase
MLCAGVPNTAMNLTTRWVVVTGTSGHGRSAPVVQHATASAPQPVVVPSMVAVGPFAGHHPTVGPAGAQVHAWHSRQGSLRMFESVDYQLCAAPFEPQLLERIRPVYVACFRETLPDDFISRVDERTESMLQLALVDGAVIGYKLGYRRNPEVFYSWLGGVSPEYRRRGIARELLQRQHAWCRSQGYRRVRTDTTNAFKDMLLLNIRAGFDVIGTYHDAERGLTIMLERALQ